MRPTAASLARKPMAPKVNVVGSRAMTSSTVGSSVARPKTTSVMSSMSRSTITPRPRVAQILQTDPAIIELDRALASMLDEGLELELSLED